ncbi:hypothetical protein [Aneurinibacillus migulanus]|uniref:hypothetical protein n=1 Tax=Aneurinibacillus migulanus TaxID=47500 RepID=UPI00209ECB9E|nr:hypothetical protein [Aneurinibacillus migulanus]MCP1355450.1 hypothetical protein [Aneurinibacillus migulanus]
MTDQELKEIQDKETSRVEILFDTGAVLTIKAIEFKVNRTASGDVTGVEWTVEKGTPNPLYINPAHVIAITEEKITTK